MESKLCSRALRLVRPLKSHVSFLGLQPCQSALLHWIQGHYKKIATELAPMASLTKAAWKLLSSYVISQMLAFLPAVRQWKATSCYGSGLSGAPLLLHLPILSQWRDHSLQKGHKTRRTFFSWICQYCLHPLELKKPPQSREQMLHHSTTDLCHSRDFNSAHTAPQSILLYLSSAIPMATKVHPEQKRWVEQQLSAPPPAPSWHFNNIILPSQN